MERLLVGQPGTVTLKVYDQDGVLVDATAVPTVVIKDSTGASVATGTATHGTTGVYTFVVPISVTGNLGDYSIEWTYTIAAVARTVTTFFQSVGGFLFEIAALRGRFNGLDDAAKYPASAIRDARTAAEERFETCARVAFVRRATTATLDGDDTTTIILPHAPVRSVTAASIGGVALTAGELAQLAIEPSGIVRRNDLNLWTKGVKNVVISYEYGYDSPPEDVSKAAMTLAFESLVPSSLNPRATSQSTDLGEFRLSVANVDMGRFTGIPEVDAVILTYGLWRPAVG